MDQLLWLLLPVAAASGWLAAKRSARKKRSGFGSNLSSEYYRGLNYLLNEEQDKALDVFLRLAQEDTEAIETHLALGGLYRRRGEVERSIRIHQNLLARPSLDASQRTIALMELAKDYMHAGLLDRAESLLLDVAKQGELKHEALEHLLKIYQREHEWEKAVGVAKRIAVSTDNDVRQMIAHCYCEIAEAALRERAPHKVDAALKGALTADPKSVRASILLGDIAYSEKRYLQAYRHYIRIFEFDEDFVPEILERVVKCVENGAPSVELDSFIRNYSESGKSGALMSGLSGYLMDNKGVAAARDYAWERLQTAPSFGGLRDWIELELQIDETNQDYLKKIPDVLDLLLNQLPSYQCRNCGYKSTVLNWQCPTCKSWGSLKPVVSKQ